jgi:hypothetical protein
MITINMTNPPKLITFTGGIGFQIAKVINHDIAVSVAQYNVDHASPANRAWAQRRLQEELKKAGRT